MPAALKLQRPSRPPAWRVERQGKLAICRVNSKNGKIGSVRNKRAKVATTYVSIKASCPRQCALMLDGTCYGMNGKVSFVTYDLDRDVSRSQPMAAARAEAWAIDNAFHGGPIPQNGARGGQDLRLHTVGDCKTSPAAGKVGAAAKRWRARGGGDVWTYTHASNDVPRSAWGDAVSVLASVDNLSQIPRALEQGYAIARYVAKFRDTKGWLEAGIRWVACPAQTRDDIGCADCRLCMDADGLRSRGVGIAFEAHGARAGKLRRRLTVVQDIKVAV